MFCYTFFIFCRCFLPFSNSFDFVYQLLPSVYSCLFVCVCLYLNIIKAYTLPLPLSDRIWLVLRFTKKNKAFWNRKIFKTIFSDMLSFFSSPVLDREQTFSYLNQKKKIVKQTLQIFTDNHTIFIFCKQFHFVICFHLGFKLNS